MSAGETMVSNFINKYGIDGLARIMMLFIDKISNQKIANEFGVTRQRVHQWQREFTKVKILPAEVVRKILNRKS